MQVVLLSFTPDPEQTVAAAARLCYSDAGAGELREQMGRERTVSFIKKLLSMGHESPLEHANFTFGMEGVSRTLTHQLVRHRIASYSQKSQRYVDESSFEYIIPPSVKKEEEAYHLYVQQMEKIREAYAALAEKVPQEDARYLLPNACETKLVVTMNARSLRNFFRLRMCRRAQWEIRNLAEKMFEEVERVAPMLLHKAGPPCEAENYCPEGRYSCGKLLHKREAETTRGICEE